MLILCILKIGSSFNDYGKVAEGYDDWMLTEEKNENQPITENQCIVCLFEEM